MTEKIIGYLITSSAAASVTFAVVIAARLILKRAPKKWSYFMWAAVFFRCLCPFSAESVFSVFNAIGTPESVPAAVAEKLPTAAGNAYYLPGTVTVPDTVTEYVYRSDAPAQSKVNAYDIAAGIWVCGAAVMGAVNIAACIKLTLLMRTAVKVRDNICESDRISTAFAMGIIRPKIYLPRGISDGEREFIIAHEKYHIRRLDHIAKPAAFAGLALHWFNPLIWIAFVLMKRDMEMSCDEAVINLLGAENKKPYSEALLKISIKRSGISAAVGFGESGIKERLTNVLRFRKPKAGVTLAAAAVMLTACAVTATDAESPPLAEPPEQAPAEDTVRESIPLTAPAEEPAEIIGDYIVHRNSKGQTYGSPDYRGATFKVGSEYENVPDLICAVGVNGTHAYIMREDFILTEPRRFNGYRHEWQVSQTNSGERIRTRQVYIPMFDSEGEPIDDYFHTVHGRDYLYIDPSKERYISLDEEALAGYSVLRSPVDGNFGVTEGFAERGSSESFHSGIEYALPEGTEIRAAADGVVIQAWDADNGYGNCIVVNHNEHGMGMMTVYAHLGEMLADQYDPVKAGEVIGKAGHTGVCTGDCLHFEVRVDGKMTDPEQFFDR